MSEKEKEKMLAGKLYFPQVTMSFGHYVVIGSNLEKVSKESSLKS